MRFPRATPSRCRFAIASKLLNPDIYIHLKGQDQRRDALGPSGPLCCPAARCRSPTAPPRRTQQTRGVPARRYFYGSLLMRPVSKCNSEISGRAILGTPSERRQMRFWRVWRWTSRPSRRCRREGLTGHFLRCIFLVPPYIIKLLRIIESPLRLSGRARGFDLAKGGIRTADLGETSMRVLAIVFDERGHLCYFRILNSLRGILCMPHGDANISRFTAFSAENRIFAFYDRLRQ